MNGGLDGVRGTAFPFRIDPDTGGVAMTEGEAKIGENVRLVIGIRLGERPMLRDLGTRVPGLVHDPDDEVLADLAGKQVVQALMRWEPRIVITSSRAEPASGPGEVRLRLDYVHTNEQVAGTAIIPLS
jgi:phage baseplate assembly protein W